MKTRFMVNDEIFGYGSLDEGFRLYEKEYKPLGFVLNKEDQDVYIDFDKEYNLNEGDKVNIYGIRVVESKIIDPVNDFVIYSLVDQ